MDEGRGAQSSSLPQFRPMRLATAGSGIGGGTGSPPSAIKTPIEVADGEAPFSLLPSKDPAFLDSENRYTANKITMQRIDSTFSLDMRPPSMKKKAGRLGSGCPPQSCSVA